MDPNYYRNKYSQDDARMPSAAKETDKKLLSKRHPYHYRQKYDETPQHRPTFKPSILQADDTTNTSYNQQMFPHHPKIIRKVPSAPSYTKGEIIVPHPGHNPNPISKYDMKPIADDEWKESAFNARAEREGWSHLLPGKDGSTVTTVSADGTVTVTKVKKEKKQKRDLVARMSELMEEKRKQNLIDHPPGEFSDDD